MGRGYEILPNFEAPIQINGIFETPIRKWHFLDPPYKIWHFRDPAYKNGIFETPHTKMAFSRPHTKIAFLRPPIQHIFPFCPHLPYTKMPKSGTKWSKFDLSLYKKWPKFHPL